MGEIILVIGGDQAPASLLRGDGAETPLVLRAPPDSAALRLLYEERPDLIILDLGSRESEGIELCWLIRQICDIPVLCLVSPDREDTLICCLEAGADDCATLPVGALELRARVQALLRRFSANGNGAGRQLSLGDILVDIDAHRVLKGGALVALTPREFKLLAVLAERPGSVVRHEELLSRVWGADFINDTHYLRLYIGYLRQKLEDDPQKPRHIVTEWGIGYRLTPGAPISEAESVTPRWAVPRPRTGRLPVSRAAAG